jgi:hypothetical protein
MKKLLPITILVFLVILGLSFLIFVLRMVWFPPGAMGMMMGKRMMLHHMYFWFGQTFWLCMILSGIIIFIWMIVNRKKDKD